MRCFYGRHRLLCGYVRKKAYLSYWAPKQYISPAEPELENLIIPLGERDRNGGRIDFLCLAPLSESDIAATNSKDIVVVGVSQFCVLNPR